MEQVSEYERRTMSLLDAITWVDERLIEGSICPCCGRNAKLYKRPLNASNARALIRVYRRSMAEGTGGRGPIHFPKIRSQGQDEVLTRHWGLIERCGPSHRPDGSPRTGWWRLTELGLQWVLDQATVPKYVCIYNNEALTVVGDPWSVRDALGEAFDYQKMMDNDYDDDI